MKIIFVLFIFMGSRAWSRMCTFDQIRAIDSARVGQEYSPYPVMTKATLVASLLPLIPHLDAMSEESTSFQTVTFVGLGGWIYFGLKSLSSVPCEDSREGKTYYQPHLNEVLDFHYREKDLFWKTYLWSGAWMLGVIATSNYVDRRSFAAGALFVPWLFSVSKKWTPFIEDQELQLVLSPQFQDHQFSLVPTLVWNF